MSDQEKKEFPVGFAVGVVVVLVLFGGLYLATRETGSPKAIVEQHLPLGPAERAYAQQIRFVDVKMSRAANFLNQEVTFVFGTLANDGGRTIRDIEVTLEFRDMFNQVVLRDTRRLFGRRVAPLEGGKSREFQLTYEDIPDDWNRQYPSIRVAGLVLE